MRLGQPDTGAEERLRAAIWEFSRFVEDRRDGWAVLYTEAAAREASARQVADLLAAVGSGPKTLQRVLRLRRALARLDAGEPDLATVAFEAGYADQAHLTNECTRLTGLPPAALARARRDPNSPANGRIAP